jgi:hypothetical protein
MITRRTALIALPLAATSGCALLNNPVIAGGLEDAIGVAVGIALQAFAGNALTIAQEVVAGLAAIISAVSGTTVTLATLETEADQAIIDSKLSPTIQTILENIIELAVSMLSTQTMASTNPGPLSTVFVYIQKESGLYVTAASSPRGKRALQKATGR